jgi:X breakpoint 2-interacting protein
MSDMSRLEAKVERLTDQLATKERELQALTSKVFHPPILGHMFVLCGRDLDGVWILKRNGALYQEQKAAAAHRAQVERLQHERDEFQRMVISTQV